jgi:hypothetical protein
LHLQVLSLLTQLTDFKLVSLSLIELPELPHTLQQLTLDYFP